MPKKGPFELYCPDCKQTRMIQQNQFGVKERRCQPCNRAYLASVGVAKRVWPGEVHPENGRYLIPCIDCGQKTAYNKNLKRCLELLKTRICRSCEAARWHANPICRDCGTSDTPYWKGHRCAKCGQIKQTEWQKRNPEKVASYKRNYLENNPEKRKATIKRWSIANRDYLRINTIRQRTARAQAPGNGLTAAEWREIKAAQNNRCFDCGVECNLSIGHLVPICRGGAHDKSNIIGQCMKCNRKQWKDIHPAALTLIRVNRAA